MKAVIHVQVLANTNVVDFLFTKNFDQAKLKQTELIVSWGAIDLLTVTVITV